MIYIYTPPTKEQHTVTFWQHEHRDLVEEGTEFDQYFLSQKVKAWLEEKNIQVIVTYDCGDMGGGEPEFTLKFESMEDAKQFVDAWAFQ